MELLIIMLKRHCLVEEDGDFWLKIYQKKIRKKMAKMYQEGYDTYTIGDVFDMSYKQILSILDEQNIKRIYSGGRRTYTLDEHYFDDIDTPNKAYILGFLYADGWNNVEKNVIQLSLQEGDKEILDKISRELKSNKPLQYVHYEYGFEKYGLHMQNQYRLVVSSHILSQALASHGCVNNKSLILEFPHDLREELYSHFLRGYFDGDGTLCRSVRNDGKEDNYSFSLVSTYNFLIEAQKCIIDNTGVPGGNISIPSCDNGITRVLTMCGRLQTKRVMDWLYKDAELYLERKHDRYLTYFYENNSQVAQRTN